MKFRAALGFFTRLPVGSAPLPPTFQGVIVWLPAIGLIVGLLAALAVALDSVYTSYAKTFSQRAIQRTCTAAANAETVLAYRVAIPRQRLR